jgi:alpha-tubulin suppressor-like RCC1 family protein
LAISSGGGLYAWGDNTKGQLGNGTSGKNYNPTPTLIGSNTWSFVSAGAEYSVAIQTNKTLWSWGLNTSGQLGDGTTISTNLPIQETSKTSDWLQVAAGSEHTIGVRSTGTLWTWGSNSDGQLGNGLPAVHRVPTQISTSKTWTYVAAGASHSVALDNEEIVWSWGRNDERQQGNGSDVDISIPTQVKK